MTEKNKSVKKFPNLRFPGFDEEWEVKRLGEIAEIKTGNKDTQNKVDNGIYPFFVRSNTVEKINTYSYDGEAILTSGDGVGVGKNFHYVNGKFDFHQRVYSIRNFKKGYDGIYIYNIFSEKFYNRVIRLSAKNSVDSVRMNMISEMKVSFPRLNEQQKIASFLAMIGERIETQKKIISQLKSQMSNLKDLIFEQKLRFKGNNGNDFPYWKDFRLSDLGNTFNGLSGKTKEHFGSGKKYIQYKQIFDSAKINIANCAFVDVEENENQNIVQYGDIFFTVSSETPEEIGMSSVLLENVDNMYLNSFCFGFRSNSFDVLIPEFSQFLFRSNKFRNEIVKLAQGSTRYNMSKTEFLKIKITLPVKDEQIKIAKFLSKLDAKINLETELLNQFENQKKYLLQNLFV